MPRRRPLPAAIKKAYEQGFLFTHMIEFDFGGDGGEHMGQMLDVMAGKEGAEFDGYGGAHYIAGERGMVGMAATALHKDYPVNLWSQQSSIGLLFDGLDSNNVNPEFFYPYDAKSHPTDGVVHYAIVPNERTLGRYGYEVFMAQDHIKPVQRLTRTVYMANLNAGDPNERATKVRGAIRDFWEYMQVDWNNYTVRSERFKMENLPNINEVTISAKLAGVKGIVVKDFEHRHDKTVLASAAALSARLFRDYPEHFAAPPPVLVYDGKNLEMADLTMRGTATGSKRPGAGGGPR